MVMVKRPHRLGDILAQFRHLELLSQEIEIEKRADIFLVLGVAQGFGVEPAD